MIKFSIWETIFNFITKEGIKMSNDKAPKVRDIYHKKTDHKFIQLQTKLLLFLSNASLKATDTQLLFYLLGHIQSGNKVYLPMYSKFATTKPFLKGNEGKFNMSKKNISLGTSRLRELNLIKKVGNGEFMFNPDFVYVGRFDIHSDVRRLYISIKDPKASGRYVYQEEQEEIES